jgi:hypothetical protein
MLKTGFKFVFAVSLFFGLVGCAIDKAKIEECVKICEFNEGMLNIQDGPVHVACRCANGLMKSISK